MRLIEKIKETTREYEEAKASLSYKKRQMNNLIGVAVSLFIFGKPGSENERFLRRDAHRHGHSKKGLEDIFCDDSSKACQRDYTRNSQDNVWVFTAYQSL